jgi:hypothetical protein
MQVRKVYGHPLGDKSLKKTTSLRGGQYFIFDTNDFAEMLL